MFGNIQEVEVFIMVNPLDLETRSWNKLCYQLHPLEHGLEQSYIEIGCHPPRFKNISYLDFV
jgi:hypothetical protein